MNDISEILRALLDQLSNTEEVEREFVDMMNEDPQLQEDYKQWCEDLGLSLKTGYQDFIDEQMQDREDFWDSMSEEF